MEASGGFAVQVRIQLQVLYLLQTNTAVLKRSQRTSDHLFVDAGCGKRSMYCALACETYRRRWREPWEPHGKRSLVMTCGTSKQLQLPIALHSCSTTGRLFDQTNTTRQGSTAAQLTRRRTFGSENRRGTPSGAPRRNLCPNTPCTFVKRSNVFVASRVYPLHALTYAPWTGVNSLDCVPQELINQQLPRRMQAGPLEHTTEKPTSEVQCADAGGRGVCGGGYYFHFAPTGRHRAHSLLLSLGGAYAVWQRQQQHDASVQSPQRDPCCIYLETGPLLQLLSQQSFFRVLVTLRIRPRCRT